MESTLVLDTRWYTEIKVWGAVSKSGDDEKKLGSGFLILLAATLMLIESCVMAVMRIAHL